MGIYDRDYYREDSRWGNPFARSQATLFLTLLLCFVFIIQIAGTDNRRADRGWPQQQRQQRDPVTPVLELDVDRALEGEVWRVVSYALVHHTGTRGILHIIFTAIFLVWIGRQVEDLYGSREYLAYFLVTTLIGGVAYTVVGAFTKSGVPLLGPSGAVTAILVLFALHYPTRTLPIWFIPVPVWLIVALYALADIAGMGLGHANPALVAVHLGGAAFAFLYHTYTLRVLNWLPGGRGSAETVRRKPRPRARPRRDEPQPEPAAAASTAGAAGAAGGGGGSLVDEHLEAKLDEVLEKVQRHGKESLTEDERGILLRASEIYKKRRRPG